jgi:hypothetical protein
MIRLILNDMRQDPATGSRMADYWFCQTAAFMNAKAAFCSCPEQAWMVRVQGRRTAIMPEFPSRF